jgi:hypothetical protein
MKTCETCRYWSQMCAQALDAGPIEALCLAADGPKLAQFTRANFHCPAWRLNSHGSVDAPPDYGEQVRALYEAEDGASK